MTEVGMPFPLRPDIKTKDETPIIDNVLLSKIAEVYKKYEDMPNKPLLTGGDCEDIARALEVLGLKYQPGFFKVDIFPGNNLDTSLIEHDWAEDGDQTIVVLDGKQFNPRLLNKEDLFGDGIELIRVGDPRHERFIPKTPLVKRFAHALSKFIFKKG